MLQHHASNGARLIPQLNNPDARELQVLKRKALLLQLTQRFANEEPRMYWQHTPDVESDALYRTRLPTKASAALRVYELLKNLDVKVESNIGSIQTAMNLEKWELHALICVGDLNSFILACRLRRLADGKCPRWFTKR